VSPHPLACLSLAGEPLYQPVPVFSPLAAMLSRIGFVSTLAAASAVVEGLTIAEIQGVTFLSPYNGQTVRSVTGIVTAKVR
jgi:maleate cis-trans isomerase